MSDQTDLFISEQTTDKLQGIIDAIAALQLQVDLQRSALIEILGGEPALQSQTLNIEGHIPIYDGSGKLISGSSLSHLSGETFTQALRVGTGPAIAGATALVNGALVVGDGAGGKVASLGEFSGILAASTTPATIHTLSTTRAVYIASAISANGGVKSVYIVTTGSGYTSATLLQGSGTYPVFSVSGYDLLLAVNSGTASLQWVLSKL